MSRRVYVPVRLSPGGLERVEQFAAAETGGNTSEMIRRLLVEAVAARDRKVKR